MRNYTYKLLPINEAKMTVTQFTDWLKSCVRCAVYTDGIPNFAMGSASIKGDNGPEEWPVIMDDHFMRRLRERTFMNADDIMPTIRWALSLPTIGRTVISNTVCWDDDAQDIVPANENNVKKTIVQLEKQNITFVFEAGFSYIRVKTICNTAYGTSKEDATKITIKKSGLIVFE